MISNITALQCCTSLCNCKTSFGNFQQNAVISQYNYNNPVQTDYILQWSEMPMLPSPLLNLTFYTSTQLTTALFIQEVKVQQMGKSRHLVGRSMCTKVGTCGNCTPKKRSLWFRKYISLDWIIWNGSVWVSRHSTSHCEGGVWKGCRADT